MGQSTSVSAESLIRLKANKTHLKDESETEGDKQDYLFLQKKKILISRAAQQLLAASGEGNEKLRFTWREVSNAGDDYYYYFFGGGSKIIRCIHY